MYKDGKVTAVDENGNYVGIDTSDVNKALGAGSNDVGTLCTHKNINPRAKYKPVPWNKGKTNNRDDVNGWTVMLDTEGKDYWKGNDGLCGLDIKCYDSETDALKAVKEGEVEISNVAAFPLQKLDNGMNPFRLSDFNGYCHAMPDGMAFYKNAFFSVGYSGGYGAETDDDGNTIIPVSDAKNITNNFEISIQNVNTNDTAFINMSDLSVQKADSYVSLTEFKYNIILYSITNNSVVEFSEMESTIGEMGDDLESLYIQKLKADTYYILVMASYVTYDLEIWIPMYKSSQFIVNVSSSDVYFSLKRVYRDEQGYAYVEVAGYNDSVIKGLTISLSDITIMYNNIDCKMLVYDTSKGAVTGSANGTITMPSKGESTITFRSVDEIAFSQSTSPGLINIGYAQVCGSVNCYLSEGHANFQWKNISTNYEAVITYSDWKYPEDIQDKVDAL